MTVRRIALAAGGTGGHVFPALSLAEALIARGHQVLVLTDKRGGAFDTEGAAWKVERIRASSPSKPGLLAKLGAIEQLGLGALDARRALKKFQADAVVGFGGYPSVPAVFAGSWLNKPAILHEQNAVLGRANRWLVARAAVVATSFDATLGADGGDQPVERTGNPVRAAILAHRATPFVAPDGGDVIRLCVFGGSLGARVFSDLVPAALALMPAELRSRLALTQQCRSEDLERVERIYAEMGVRAEIQSFFDDIPDRLAAAHLVIARAGASTVCELAVIGRPSILVPYPHAMDDHQTRNAAAMEAAGGGWMMPESTLTAETLAARIEALITDPAALTKAATAAHGFGVPDAVDRLADLVIRAASVRRGEPLGTALDGQSNASSRLVERKALA
jgi:UDP-N-acetylglucosamine--N-acetylmuramyl-(pentapeptide) pyrophosphoryl-undecaprenol N-acetylglucosamine transferase